MAKLVEVIALVREIPEEYLEEALAAIKGIKEKAEQEQKSEAATCPHCNSERVVRNGRKSGKQAFLCRACNKSFVQTSKSAIENSHSGATVWKQVISDTVRGIPIDKTADSLGLHHETVFNMRHKILYCVERSLAADPVKLVGVCEADETYVLESVKGKKIPENYHRKPRRHGAVALKRGISNEYICICASVTAGGENVAIAANRASPSGQEILGVFGDRVEQGTVVLCDGKTSYNALEDRCTVATTKRVNRVNGFHSFIKQRLDAMRGVSTAYLNRYNALFSKLYGAEDSVVDEIFEMMTAQKGFFNTIAATQSTKLLCL